MVKIISEQQQVEFEASGVLKIKSLISPEAISFARNAILSRFEALNISLDGEWQLDEKPRPTWPDKGYSTKQIGNKIREVGRLLDEPAIKTTIDSLLGHAERNNEMFKRPQILVTFPNEGDWFMPKNGWHVDIPRLASRILSGVQIFILLNEIKPQGGGTLAVSGSHRLLNTGDFIRSRDVTKRLRKYRFFNELMLANHSSIDEFQSVQDIKESGDNIKLRIIEMTGAPGDVFFMDTRVIHSGAPNTQDQPRMMATHRFVKSDTVRQMLANQ